MKFDGFDWDGGNRGKCQIHGVSIAEIESLFSGNVGLAPDPAHSESEERIKAIGTTKEGRAILVVFTWRHQKTAVLVRPVSARYMHKKEIAWYEAETADPDE